MTSERMIHIITLRTTEESIAIQLAAAWLKGRTGRKSSTPILFPQTITSIEWAFHHRRKNMRNIVWALLLPIAIAGCSGSSQGPFHTASPLDKILVMGKDSRQAWKQFMQNGGLQTSDQWRAYTVQNLSLGFDSHHQLSEASLILTAGVGNRTPSFQHISHDLADICGTDWHKGKLSTAQNGNILCVFSPGKTTAYYRLEISKMEGMGIPGI